jgi:hypothetical protein
LLRTPNRALEARGGSQESAGHVAIHKHEVDVVLQVAAHAGQVPAGMGVGNIPPKFLKPGDVVRCEIDKLGHIEGIMVAGRWSLVAGRWLRGVRPG